MDDASGQPDGQEIPRTLATFAGSSVGLSVARLADWWMRAMEANSIAHGLPGLTTSQAWIITNICLGEHRAIRLAQKMGVSRQAVHFLIGQLIELGLVELRKDPNDKRARMVDFTPEHAKSKSAYVAIMAALEIKLRKTLGKDFDTFRNIATMDWGPPPILSKAELGQAARTLQG